MVVFKIALDDYEKILSVFYLNIGTTLMLGGAVMLAVANS